MNARRVRVIWGAWLLLLVLSAGVAWAGETLVVTTASDGTPANADIQTMRLSGDGRVAAFITAADNLVPGDTNGTQDLFTKDLATGQTRRVNLCADGSQMNQDVTSAAISRDGTYVAFVTRADAYTPSGPALAYQAIYLAEIPSGPVEAVFYDPQTAGPPTANTWVNSISADGRYLAFTTDIRDGRFDARDTDQYHDVYVYDRESHTFTLASVNDAGEKANRGASLSMGPAMTPDGRYVIFTTASDNLVSGDTNGCYDVFLRDLVGGTTTRVSLTSAGTQVPTYNGFGCEYPAISPDGRYVSFTSYSSVTGLPIGVSQAFVRDLLLGTTEAVSTNGQDLSNTSCWGSYVSSGDTHLAIFQSTATNLVPGLTDSIPLIYARDLTHDLTDVVSCSSDGQQTLSPVGLFSPDEAGETVAFVGEPVSGVFHSLVLGPAQGYQRVRGPFWDVGARFWAVSQIEACSAAGIVGGYSNGSYRPAAAVSRDQMAVFIQRADSLPLGAYAGEFSDLTSDHWAAKQIQSCVDAGIVGGYPDGTYKPASTVTRDQMAVFVSRALAGGDAAVPSGPATATFPDVASDHWAFRYVEYAVVHHVVGGYPNGTYRPLVVVDRATMAVYMRRAFLP